MASLETQISATGVQATKLNAAATLAAALIAASGRPHSVDEALQLVRDFQWSLWPSPNNGAYQNWKKNFNGTQAHK